MSLATSLQGLRTYGEMTGTRRKFHRLLSVLTTASEHEWPMAVSMTITKANCDEAADMFVAAALSCASRIQMGVMMAEGRGREREIPRLSSYSAGNHMNRLSMTTQRLRAINPAIVDDSLEGAGV